MLYKVQKLLEVGMILVVKLYAMQIHTYIPTEIELTIPHFH